MNSVVGRLALAALCGAVWGCRTTEERGPVAIAVPPPSYAVQHLLDPCWPPDSPPEQRVVLTLIRGEDNALKDVMFEPKNGASNSVGRCLRQVVWRYPWRGDVPETIEIAPPSAPSNGWAVLEHVRLLTSDAYLQPRGIVDAIPLVQACLAHGTGTRPEISFHVSTAPVRVTLLSPQIGSVVRPTDPVTDTERCIQAVLASTAYPGSRAFVFDFGRGAAAGEPAPRDAVAHYLEPAGITDAPGEVDQSQAKAALAGIQQEVGKCWEATLDRRGAVSGGRTFRIRVEPSGRVGFVQVVGNRSEMGDAVDYQLDKCVADAVRAARIPPPEGGPGEFAYSWVFAQRQ